MARGLSRCVLGLSALSLCGVSVLALGSAPAGAAGKAQAKQGDPSITQVITSADVALNLRMAEPGHPISTLRANGQIDFAAHNVSMTIALPGPTTRGANHAGALDLQGKLINGVIYLSVPPALATLAGTAATTDYAVSPATATEFTTALSQTAVAVTYARILLGTLATSQDLRRVGNRTIGGVRVSGTSLDLTLGQLFKVMPAMSPIASGDLAPLAHSEIPVTLWVDSKGRLVQATMAQPAGAKTWIAGTLHFSHFNAPATITSPAASTVQPMSKAELTFLEAADPFGGQG